MHTYSSKIPRNGAVLLQYKGLTSLLDTYWHDSDLYKLSKLSLVSNTAYKMKAKNTIALSDECQNAHSPHYFPCANPQQWQQPARHVWLHCAVALFYFRTQPPIQTFTLSCMLNMCKTRYAKKTKQNKKQNVTEILVLIRALLFSYFSKTKCIY